MNYAVQSGAEIEEKGRKIEELIRVCEVKDDVLVVFICGILLVSSTPALQAVLPLRCTCKGWVLILPQQ